jgi:hypothetical protein
MRPTNFFHTTTAAVRCFTSFGYSREQIEDKLWSGEIRIGSPTPQAGERVVLDTTDGRYYIEGV